jgi:hypothetical protein
MYRRHALKFVALTPLLFSNLLAQNPSPQSAGGANKGRQVLDQALAAMGGDRYLHLQNRIASGRIYAFFRDQLSGLDLAKVVVDYASEAPPKGLAIREREYMGKKLDYSYLFLADQAWDITFRGARPVPDEDWERYLRTTRNDILYILRYRLNEPGMQFDYIGSDVYLSRHVEIVDLTDSADQTVRVYLDHNTMLPVHQTFKWFDEKMKTHDDEVTEYDKYRDAGGVMWPYSIERQRNGYKVYQLFAEKVEINQALPPKTFEVPPGSKLLKKDN